MSAGAGARAAAEPRESVALGGRALALVRGLPDHSLIDRLVRGQAWIPVLGVLLVGIVAMQVEILKLGSSMGRAMERSSALQTQNESLQAGVAGLADDQRIERLAAGMGMSMATPDSLVFLSAHPGGDVGRALANIHAPDPTGFVARLAAQAAAIAALMPAPPTTSGTATTTGTAGIPTSPATSAPATTTPTSAPATVTPGATPASAGGPAVTPTASGTGAAAASGSSPGVGTSAGTGIAATGAAGVAPVGSSQSGGTTGG